MGVLRVSTLLSVFKPDVMFTNISDGSERDRFFRVSDFFKIKCLEILLQLILA